MDYQLKEEIALDNGAKHQIYENSAKEKILLSFVGPPFTSFPRSGEIGVFKGTIDENANDLSNRIYTNINDLISPTTTFSYDVNNDDFEYIQELVEENLGITIIGKTKNPIDEVRAQIKTDLHQPINEQADAEIAKIIVEHMNIVTGEIKPPQRETKQPREEYIKTLQEFGNRASDVAAIAQPFLDEKGGISNRSNSNEKKTPWERFSPFPDVKDTARRHRNHIKQDKPIEGMIGREILQERIALLRDDLASLETQQRDVRKSVTEYHFAHAKAATQHKLTTLQQQQMGMKNPQTGEPLLLDYLKAKTGGPQIDRNSYPTIAAEVAEFFETRPDAKLGMKIFQTIGAMKNETLEKFKDYPGFLELADAYEKQRNPSKNAPQDNTNPKPDENDTEIAKAIIEHMNWVTGKTPKPYPKEGETKQDFMKRTKSLREEIKKNAAIAAPFLSETGGLSNNPTKTKQTPWEWFKCVPEMKEAATRHRAFIQAKMRNSVKKTTQTEGPATINKTVVDGIQLLLTSQKIALDSLEKTQKLLSTKNLTPEIITEATKECEKTMAAIKTMEDSKIN